LDARRRDGLSKNNYSGSGTGHWCLILEDDDNDEIKLISRDYQGGCGVSSM